MIWKGWNNGSELASGAGYGLKMTTQDRDANFKNYWTSVKVQLPGEGQTELIEVRITPSFWRKCSELRSAKIGKWLIQHGYAPWTTGSPPEFTVEMVQDRLFRVM